MPGTITRGLSALLGVDAPTAMRIALLYGDIEWLAAGAGELRYSASDYARRQGMHRNTVHADLHRLAAIGAIQLGCDRANSATIVLRGLLPPASVAASHVDQSSDPCPAEQQPPCLPEQQPLAARSSNPCLREQQPPCLSEQQPLAARSSNPLLPVAATLEKRIKILEKKKKSKKASQEQEPLQTSPGSQQQPPSPTSREQGPRALEPSGLEPTPWEAKPPGAAAPDPRVPEPRAPDPQAPDPAPFRAKANPSTAQEPSTSPNPRPEALLSSATEPGGQPTSSSPEPGALLAELLATFRSAAPAEWPLPRQLTLTAGRRAKLQAALAHAGGPEALHQQLRTALEQVPPWFRSTYPTRPDGSRRPSHQFFDLLFRAAAAERDGGPEAWHVFAWSEAGGQPPSPGVALPPGGAESDGQRAQRLFCWGGSHWLMREIEALQLPLAERRRLTALLESGGQGTAGAGALQFADPTPATAASTLQAAPEAACTRSDRESMPYATSDGPEALLGASAGTRRAARSRHRGALAPGVPPPRACLQR
jgi:hypothetical protein